MLDNIEHNLQNTKDYVVKAKENLDEARELQKSARKKMCCIVIIILVIFGFGFGGYKYFL